MSVTARRRAWASPSRRLPVAALAAALALGPALHPASATSITAVGGVAPTTDETPAEGLSVVLDEVEPVVARPGEPLTLRGRVLNPLPTTTRLSSLTVSASRVPLASRAAVADWLEGRGRRETGWVLGDDTIGPLVPPRGALDFTVSVPEAVLEQLPAEPTALAVRLTARAEGDGVPLGGPDSRARIELRTVLTTAGTADVQTPLEIAWVVPLTLPADPDLVNPAPSPHAQAWMSAVGKGSVVRRWLDHLVLPGVTWLVDPALLVAPRPEPSIAFVAPEPGEEGEPAPSPTTATPTTGAPTPTDDPPTDDPPADHPAGTTSPTDDTGAGTTDPGGTTGVRAPGDDDGQTQPPGEGGGQPPDAEAAPADGDDVQRALAGLRAALGRHPDADLWWLPTGDPDLAVIEDLAGLEAGALGELLSRPPADAPAPVTRLLQQGRADVLWPALTAPTEGELRQITELWGQSDAGSARAAPGVALLPREAFTGSSDAGPRRGAVALQGIDLLALGADSWTSALVADSGALAEEQGEGAATQRLLAHTLATYQEDPTTPRELVIAPPRDSAAPTGVLDQLSTGWQEAGWLDPVSADELLGRAVGTYPVVLSGIPPQEAVLGELTAHLEPPESPVDGSRGRSLFDLDEDLDGLTEVLQDTDALRSWRPVLAGLWSTRWRQDPEGWAQTWRALRADVRTTRGSVHVTPTTINFLADQGTVLVTVVNDLPIAVEDVQLRLEPDNARLQVVQQPEPVSIGAGSRASVPFEARALTRGDVTLTARLSTPDGTDLGTGQQLAVNVRPTGIWIYWVLGGLAGIVLVLGLVRALRGTPRVPRTGTPTGPRAGPAGAPASPAGGSTAYPGPAPSTGKETSS